MTNNLLNIKSRLFNSTNNNNEAVKNAQSETETVEPEKTYTSKVEKVNLEDWGFEQAGRCNGHIEQFNNCLNLIYRGHVVDDKFDVEVQRQRKAKVQEQIEATKQNIYEKIEDINREIITQTGLSEKISENNIPAKQKLIADFKDDISEIQISSKEKTLNTGFSPIKAWGSSIITLFLTIYLILFYASASHSAFFREIAAELQNANAGNIGSLLNSIFNPSAIFAYSDYTIIIYLFSAVIFAFGWVGHHFFHKDKFWNKFTGAVVIAISLALDALIAYKIDSNMILIKQLNGIETNDAFYMHSNFWMVLILGFGAYLGWTLLFNIAHDEFKKRNHTQIANFKISLIKDKIKLVEKDILELKNELTEIKSQLQILKSKIENLKLQLDSELNRLGNEMEKISLDIHDVSKSLANFQSGWLRYLTNRNNSQAEIELCKNEYKAFINTLN